MYDDVLQIFNINVCNEGNMQNTVGVDLTDPFYLLLSKGKSTTNKNLSTVSEETLVYLSAQERIVFFSIYLIICIAACAGNIAAIIATSRRKHRYIQKTFVISLALSDLLTATIITVWYLRIFLEKTIVWTLGSSMCSLLPSVPIFGAICSSAALVGIALDRYRNVVHALKKRWNPGPWVCILSAITIWCLSIGLAYPMTTFFETQPLQVVYFDYDEHKVKYRVVEMCLSFQRDNLRTYFVCMMCLVFLPLIFIFLWFYYKIAQIIWKHRKPLSEMFHKKYENSVTVETSTSQIRQSEEYSKASSIPETAAKPVVKTRNAQIQRKMRTFKIIVFLMFIFLVLRLPSWFYDTLKLTSKITTHAMWISKYVFMAMVLLHCSLNPFLYTFLNLTVNLCKKVTTAIQDFVCGVCCCCLSNAEFEEFENENPFVREHFEKRCHNGGNNPILNKINQRNSRKKLEGLSAAKLCKKADVKAGESYKAFQDSKRAST